MTGRPAAVEARASLLIALASASVTAVLVVGTGSPEASEPAVRGLRLRVGKGPGSIAIADVNGDRRPDLVVANEQSDDVSVLLGDGKGGFAPAPGSPFPAGNGPNDLALADFDGDGRTDVAVPNHDSSHVTLLLGDGTGAFRPAPRGPIPVQSRPHPHGLAAGDFDGDGRVDLVTESWEVDRLELLFGDGRGGFRTPGPLVATGRTPYHKVRAADLDGDRRADVVTTNHGGGSLTILLAGPGGAFREAAGSPVATAASPFALAIGDLSGDGRLDLAVAHYSGSVRNRGDDGVSVLLGDGTGRFRPAQGSPFLAGHAPTSLAIADVDGDGVGDLVVANLGSNDVTVWRGSRDGRPSRGPTWPVGRSPQGIAAADLDGDGRADVVTANTRDDDLTVLRIH